MKKMTKKRFASGRNWQKARLMGFKLNPLFLSSEERGLYADAMRIVREILDNWDETSRKEFKMSVTPKCHICGTTEDVEFRTGFGEDKYSCFECYKNIMS